MASNNVTLEEQIVIEANKAINAIDGIKKSVKSLKGETSSAGKAIKTGLAFGGLLAGGRKLVSFLKTADQDAKDLVETANLFEVSMGKGIDGLNKYYEKAIKFQNQLSEALGTNINESMNFQALFNSMATSMGLDRAVAYKISENFTKLGYDLASLYNTETDKAMQKLQSGLSGASTRPLRAFGIDITQSTLSSTLGDLGLDKKISELNQAEKMVLRYIAVLRQSAVAHGDFARTLESPANQLRIFQAQCLAFRQNIGNLWQGIYARWMPYINGIMMAINALIRVIGGFFGIKFGTSMQSASKSLQAGASGAGGMAKGLKDASGSAKDLKEELDLMPWDEIHNIDLGKDSSSGGGGGSSGGGGGGGGMSVDPALLSAMEEYDNMMGRVRNKATDIRDKIMEWLGFTKKINPFTNEISWEYTGMSKTARMIVTALKAIVAIGIAGKLIKLLGHLGTLKGVLAGTIKPTTAFQTGLAGIVGGFKTTIEWSKTFVSSFAHVYKTTDGTRLQKFSKALKDVGKPMWAMIPAVVKLAGGIVGLALSFNSIAKTTREMSNANEKTAGSFIKLGAGMTGAVASGALLGSVILPGVGTAIGAVAGGLIGLTGAFVGWQTDAEKYAERTKENKKANDEYFESIERTSQAIKDNANGQLAYVGYAEKLGAELENLVDKEGKVKAGMKERVEFILGQLNDAMGTEYKLVGDHIENYENLTSSIKEVIEQKKAEIMLNAYEEEYANAIKRQAELQKKKRDLQLEVNDGIKQQKELTEKINSLNPNNVFDAVKILEYGKQLKTVTESLKTNTEELSKADEQYVKDGETIIEWENLKEAVISENNQKIGESMDELLSHREDNAKSTAEIISTGIQQEIDDWNNLKANKEKMNEDIYNNDVTTHEKQIEDLLGTLTTTEELIDASNPDIVEAWRKIAHFSEEKYDEYISKLPQETQDAIDDAIAELDGKQPRARKAGEDLAQQPIDGAEAKVNDPKEGIIKIAQFMIDGLINGLTLGTPLNALYQAGKTIIGKVLEGAKDKSEERSPSKAMRRIGDYMTQGLALGLEDSSGDAVNAVKTVVGDTLKEANKLTNGVNINPSEYSVDANKFIDYGSVSGSIASQVSLTDNISDKIYTAVMNGFRNSSVNVEIEAKTEDGILLKKVQTQAKEYRMQTGKAPFPTM